MTEPIRVLIMVADTALSGKLEECAESQRLRATCVQSSATCLSAMENHDIFIVDGNLPNGTSRLLVANWIEIQPGPVCVLGAKDMTPEEQLSFYRMGVTHVVCYPTDTSLAYILLTNYTRTIRATRLLVQLTKRVRQLTIGLVINSLLLVASIGPEIIPWILELLG